MDLAHALHARPDAPEAIDPSQFSIVLGGPLYQLLRRAHVSGDALELARRRIVAIALLAWLPLAVLALVGRAAGPAPAVTFLHDVEVHVRFLVAVPLLVGAELLVHLRLRPVAGEFMARGLIPEESTERFRECLRSAFRLRNSVLAEVLIIAFVYGVGIHVLWKQFAVLDVATWYATPTPEGPRFTAAGWWYVYVSVPLFQFLLLRWYFRMAIWIRFLWQVSRIPLNITAMHGDGHAGLGFLSGTVYAFVPLLMAHGAIVAGNIANRIFYQGAKLPDTYGEIAIVVGYLLVLVLAPLTFFSMQISAAKRRDARLYGRLAQRYARDFEAKWIGTTGESPLGTGDIQSLADMSNSLATVRATSGVPITRDAVIRLAVATLAPIAPLLLTIIPARELAQRLIKLLL
jgi:hypothetical protein